MNADQTQPAGPDLAKGIDGSTNQRATGFNAGARTASPVRMLKQA